MNHRIFSDADGNDAINVLDDIISLSNIRNVPSGILHIFPFSSNLISRLNGEKLFDPITQKEWEQCYFDFHKGRVAGTSGNLYFPDLQQLKLKAKTYHQKGIIPLAIVNLLHHRPNTQFFNDISRAVQEGNTYNIPGIFYSTLEKHRSVFCVALLPDRFNLFTPLQHEHSGQQIKLLLDSSFYISNDPSPIEFVDVLLSQERNHRKRIDFGESLDINFASEGTHLIQLGIHLKDKQLNASFLLPVKSKTNIPPWDATWLLSAVMSYKNKTAQGTAYVLYGCEEGIKHTSIVHPVLIADGFPGHSYEDIYQALAEENFIASVLNAGYDIILLSYEDGTTYIQSNAFVAVRCILDIIAKRTSNEKLIVGGASMGGIITRYALAWMEDQRIDHQTKMYFSFDSPHAGANIQYGIQVLVTRFAAFNSEAAKYAALLQSPAASQFLIYRFSGIDLFKDFYSELYKLGFPSRVLKSIAISNGAGDGQQVVPDNVWTIKFVSNYSLILANAWSLPNMKEEVVAYFSTWQWKKYSINNTLNFDGAPGGQKSTTGDLATALIGSGTTQHRYDNSCFIPTFSSLGMSLATSPYGKIPRYNARTPFDKYFISATNTLHVAITPEINLFFLAQLDIMKFAGALSVTYYDVKKRFQIFGISPLGDLLHIWWDGTKCRGESLGGTSLGGGLTGDSGSLTTLFKEGGTYIHIFTTSARGNLLHRFYGNCWSEWEDLGVYPNDNADGLSHNIAAVEAKGVIHVFGITVQGNLVHRCLTDHWLRWDNLGSVEYGGGLGGGLSVIYRPEPDILDVFTISLEGHFLQRCYVEEQWQDWIDMGICDVDGSLSTTPGNLAVSYENGSIYTFVISTDGHLLYRYYNQSWLNWQNLGMSSFGLQGGVTVINGANPIDVFAISNQGHLLHKCYAENTWWPWNDMTENVNEALTLPVDILSVETI
jgi:hypothetical protein